jgi:flagellar hook-length control protein FliK
MSMDPVQFEPKITTDLQIDWRRPSREGSDPFADLLAERLKKRFESDRHDASERRRHPVADAVSGRPPRVVIAHPRTLRGEAKEVDNLHDRRLPDQTDRAGDEGAVAAADDTAALEDGTAGADTPAQDETAEAPTKTETATAADQPALMVNDQNQPAAPVATIVVVTQPADPQAAGIEQEAAIILPVPVPAEGQGATAGQTDQETNTETGGSPADTDAAAQQQAVAAMAEAGLSAVAATLNTGGAAPSSGAAPALVVTQPVTSPAALIDGEQPLVELPQAPAAALNVAPVQPQAERPPMDIKPPRPGSSTHANAGASDPAPSAATTPQSAHPHQAVLLQPGAASEWSAGDMADQSLSTDDSGPGWMTHLAQGAAGKRADFVAQLRQHLQNLPAHEQVAVHIQRAVREGTGKFSIQLSPSELGRIQVKLEIGEDKRVTAAVTVERPSTLELLQRDVKGLERALHNAGLTMEGGDLSFSLGRGSDQDFAQDLNQSAASAADRGVLDVQADGEQADSLAAQVMDTAAGIVNLQV